MFKLRMYVPCITKQRQLLRPKNNLKKKTDPSEIERTYNIRKQQTQYY